MRFVSCILALVLLSAFTIDKKLENPNQEQQAQQIFHEVRCLVCAGESLAESNADFSVDMRGVIREQVAAGKTEAEIKEYLVSRYGENTLQSPPVNEKTYLLWFAPLLLLVGGAIVVFRNSKR